MGQVATPVVESNAQQQISSSPVTGDTVTYPVLAVNFTKSLLKLEIKTF